MRMLAAGELTAIRKYSRSNENVKVYSSLGSQNYLSFDENLKSNNWKLFKWNN